MAKKRTRTITRTSKKKPLATPVARTKPELEIDEVYYEIEVDIDDEKKTKVVVDGAISPRRRRNLRKKRAAIAAKQREKFFNHGR